VRKASKTGFFCALNCAKQVRTKGLKNLDKAILQAYIRCTKPLEILVELKVVEQQKVRKKTDC
jgi:hypothetical protein